MSALIAYRNLSDAATLTGPAETGFPLSNLKTRQLSTRWRVLTPDDSDHDIVIDLGAEKAVRVFAFLGCVNMARSMTMRTSADGVSWSAGISPTVVDDDGCPDLPDNIFFLTPGTTYVFRYFKLSVKRSSGAAFMEAGRLWVSMALDIPYGANSDWSISTRERGSVDESAGLQIYPSAKPRGRELRMSFGALDVEYAYGVSDEVSPVSDVPSFQDLHTYAGAIGEVIAFPRTNHVWPRRLGIYGRLSEDSLSIRHMAGPNYATEVRVIEER